MCIILQEILHLAARILKLALGETPIENLAQKRNAGMLDAVLDMPDLLVAGRRR